MYRLLVLAILLMAMMDLNMAQGVGKGDGNGVNDVQKNIRFNAHGKGSPFDRIHKKFDPKEIEIIMSKCDQKPNKCRGQLPEYEEKRNATKQNLIDLYMKQLGISQGKAQKEAEKRLEKVYAVKKTIFVGLGVTEIDPADDGTLIGGDTPLTEQEMYDLEVCYSQTAEEAYASDGRKKRGAAIFFEQDPSKRWTMPVHFWINMSSGWTAAEVLVIKHAQAIIMATVPCIKFQEDVNQSDRDQIHYIKERNTISTFPPCTGWSYSGHLTYGSKDSTTGLLIQGNPVALKSLPGNCTGPYGGAAILHETVHALGAYHEMSRPDRDKYIVIVMNDPQADLAQVAVLPNTGSYGVPYNTISITHYMQGLGGLSYISKTNASAQFGFNVTFNLTAEDILQLKRMYCEPGCQDTIQLYQNYQAFVDNIGSTCDKAVSVGKCTSTALFTPYSDTYAYVMGRVCTKSCDMCLSCLDARVTCGDDAIAGKCSNSTLKAECPKSCGVCD